MKMKLLITAMVSVLVCSASLAQNTTQIGRYLTVDNKPSAAQINPLLTVQQVHFPVEVKTVGDAINYWVSYSGYQLVDKESQSEPLKELLAQKLPQADRSLGPLTVQDGLKVLAGMNVFNLVQDPLHRKVSFKLNRKYQRLLNQKKGRGVV